MLIDGLYISGYQGVQVWLLDCIYQDIEGYRFEGWGGHTGRPFNAYLTAAAAIGKYFDQLFNKLVGGGSVSFRVFNWTWLFKNDLVSCLMWIYSK